MNYFITNKRGFQLLACILAIWGISSSQSLGQVNTFPYFYDFENENTGSTGCNPSYTMVETGWVNASGDDMDWTNDVNATGSTLTGPNEDHTPSPGTFYMYLETSCSANRTANLETPAFDFTSAPAPQLSFWYHMYGADMGTLHLEVSTNNGTTWTSLWSLSGQQQTSTTDPWLQAVVNIAAYGGQNNVKFRFRGNSLAAGFDGDMAIDDFLVENILPDNAGITAMTSPVLGAAAGNYSVDVDLQNFGSNALNSVDIEWEINGVAQPTVSYTGPAVPAFTATNVNLSASTAFPSGLTNLKFWTSMPNGVVDSDTGNDTLNTIFCTGLAGTYTVGTATSDFATIADAEAALNGCGMAGPVTMQVQAGTYSPLTIQGTIPGLSATNTLTWDGSNQTAIIQATSGIAVLFDGADYVTLQNFTINNTSTGNATMGVLLTDAADFNTIRGNRIIIASTSFSSAGIASSGSTTSATTSDINASNTLIENNTVIGGYRGISLYGDATVADYNSNNIIRNNDIEAYYYGIYVYYQDSLEVDGNYVHDMANTFNYGTYAFSTMNSRFTANRVIANNYGMYFSATNSRTTPTRRTLVANNMVISDATYGVYFTTVDETDFFHNTIKTTGVADALTITGIDNTFDIKNNVFYSEGGYALQSFSTAAVLDMDYNLFYTPATNPNFIDYNGLYADLVDWQTNGPLGYDQNSIEGEPRFAGPEDLHADGPILNDVGTLTTVLIDIDGDVRPVPGSGGVDIGADEFTPPANDAGVVDLLSPTLPISGGFASVEIAVQNFGVNTLNSFMVEWEIDGVAQQPVPYTGAPVSTLSTTNMILANINFPANTTSLKFWTSMPNGMIDDRFSNDTLKVDICPGIQGIYTVGLPTSDFPTVADAMATLTDCGISGPTELQFQIGTYGPLVINKVPGTSATNTLTFNGIDPADATITHNATGIDGSATVTLNGAEYVTIKNFTIVSTGTAPAYGVILTNAADHNTIMDNNIVMPYNSGITNVIGILASNTYNSSSGTAAEGNNANYTTIQGNDIFGGQAGIILEGGISDNENIGNRILNNDIHDADDWGIYVDEQDSFEISGNEVYDIRATTSDAIACFDIHNFIISANNVISRDYGIQVDGGFSVIDRSRYGKIYNNMVVGTGTASEAMYLRDVDQIQIYHNSLVGAPGLYLANHSNVDILNNILSTSNDYCLELVSATGVNVLDYNLYYVSNNGDAVRYNATNYLTLNDWRTTGPPVGYDANSVSGNPNFINGLHIGSALAEDAGTATGLAFAVNEDFDGETRPMGTAPDIGADEAVIRANDAMSIGLISPSGCGNAAADVIVSVANAGTTTLLNVPVTVNVTGAATNTFNFNAAIMPAGQAFTYTVGTLNTTMGGTYNFEIIVAAGTDTNPMNDTVNVSVTINPDNENALTNVGDTLVCEGNVAELMVNSSVPNTAILWYDSPTGGSLINTGMSYTTPSAITGATSYYVALQGCDADRKEIVVTADTVGIMVDLGADSATICSNGAVELIPTITNSTAMSTTWSNGAQSSPVEVRNSGTYSVMVMNASGCTDSDTIEVLTLAQPTITSNVVAPNCGGAANGSIDLTVTGTPGPYTYNWSNNSTVEDQTALSGGVYLVTLTDNSNGLACSYVEAFQISEPTPLVTNVDLSTTSCNGNDGTIDLTTSGGTAGYTYNWSNGASTEDLSGLAGGNYDVTVSDANGCTTTNSASVATVNPIVVNVDTVFNEILDVQGSIQLTVTGGSGPLQYVWSTGATTEDLDSINAGSYTVSVVDPASGCQTVVSNIVVEYQIPDMVNTIQSVSTLKVFPNPTQDKVFINIELNEMTEVQLEIMSVTGQRLQAFTPSNNLQQNYEVDLSNYPAGVYLARMIIGDQVTTAKIILSRN